MSETSQNKAQKRINVNLLNDEADAFENFKDHLEKTLGIPGLTHTAVIRWLINNNKLSE